MTTHKDYNNFKSQITLKNQLTHNKHTPSPGPHKRNAKLDEKKYGKTN